MSPGLLGASNTEAGLGKCIGPVPCPLEEVMELRYELVGLWCDEWPAGKAFVEYAPSLNREASGGDSSVP